MYDCILRIYYGLDGDCDYLKNVFLLFIIIIIIIIIIVNNNNNNNNYYYKRLRIKNVYHLKVRLGIEQSKGEKKKKDDACHSLP